MSSINNQYIPKEQKSYRDDASEAAFLLGGIGTGTISITPRGEMKDWEIFNRPAKGNKVPYSFFSVWAREEGGQPVARVIESGIRPPYSQTHGYHSGHVAGLPRLESSVMRAKYPFVHIDYFDSTMPVKLELEAFTPFIPLNADDSGIPGIVFRYAAENTGDRSVEVTIAGSFANLVGFEGYDVFENMKPHKGAVNQFIDEEKIRGISCFSSTLQHHQLGYGSMAFITRDRDITIKANWLDGSWWDGVQEFWNDFSDDGKLNADAKSHAISSRIGPAGLKVGSLGICKTLAPGERKVFEFVLAWHFPNRVKSWFEDSYVQDGTIEKNYYSVLFQDAWEAGRYLVNNMERLERASRKFADALHGSTMPDYVIDAVTSNITVIRSNTCFRIENGTFLAYEGCHDSHGSCEGTCTHVWNYAQTLAFLFPELEKSARVNEFNTETDETGRMAFRSWQVFGKDKLDLLPAADGQLGTIIRLYREWKLTGDDAFLRSVWVKAAKALEFAFDYWDTDGDFVLDSQQHNTYDIEFYGANSLTNSLFLAALKAGAEMAEYLGERECAEKYRQAFEAGSHRMDELLFNGRYYVQKLEDVNQYRYQYGSGCLSDQLFGQTLAHLVGLGYILPVEHVKSAALSIFKHNFRESMKNHSSVQRTYALNDESGLLLCTWPDGGRPELPFVYSDEVWTGIEYHVAALLIFEGFVDEGLKLVKAVRDRHDGYKRNPWDEVECGHHYARSLASWSVLIALSGFQFDMIKGIMDFAPRLNEENFSCFWSTGKAWGVYRQKNEGERDLPYREVEILYGTVDRSWFDPSINVKWSDGA